MNSTTRGVLIGMIWGDGCLKLHRHTKKDGNVSVYCEFAAGHSSKQKDYIEFKRNRFHSLMGGKIPKICTRTFKLKGYETDHTELRFSKQHKYFKVLHRWIYPKGKKVYTRRILDMMNDEGLAFWYMDDGGLSKSKRPDGTVTSVEMRLFTYCTKEEAEIIVSYFKDTYNVTGRLRKYNKNQSYNVVFNTTEAKKLELIMKPYMADSMLYKLPSKWLPRAPSP